MKKIFYEKIHEKLSNEGIFWAIFTLEFASFESWKNG